METTTGHDGRLEQLTLLKEGKERWNQWRREHPDVIPNLVDAELNGAILKELDLRRARLNGANLVRADLFGSDLSGAQLNGANLSEVRAANVNFSGADLSGCDLRWAFLVKANLNGALLNGADLSNARLKGSSLVRADLSGATLRGTHLNRTDLTRADLSGAILDEIDLQDSYLPDISEWGDLFSAYRRQSKRFVIAEQQEKKDGSMENATGQIFTVRNRPRVVIKDTGGTIYIRAWKEPEIKVESTGVLPQLLQEEDTVFITGGEGAIELLVPHIPHGIVRLVKHGSSTVLTEIVGENLRGDIVIEDCGAVSLKQIDGQVALQAITGDVVLDHVSKGVILDQITGSVCIKDTIWVVMDIVRGNVYGEQIKQALHCGYVGGNCRIEGNAQAEITVGRVGGNARIYGVAQALDCQVGGNADIRVDVARGGYVLVEAGGNIKIFVAEDANLRASLTAGSVISREATGDSVGGTAYFSYGQGRDSLDVTAGGGIRLYEASGQKQ